MFDILVYLVENYFHNGQLPDAETITKRLSAAGFEDDDISEALTWLSGFGQPEESGGDEAFAQSRGFRIYAEEELTNLTVEARGFIIFLQDSDIISAPQRELIIERVLALPETSVDLERIKLIVLMVLWNQQQSVDSLVLELLASRDYSSPQ
jgi:Smg protein